MTYAAVGVVALIIGIWLGGDSAECRIYNQLNRKGVAFIKGVLFQGGVHTGRVE